MLALNSWGPSGWHFIHAIMMCSPEELDEQQQTDMLQFLRLLGKVCPVRGAVPTFYRSLNETCPEIQFEHEKVSCPS